MPHTIIYIIPSLIQSGPVNVLLGIVRHLDRTRFRPVVVELSRHRFRHRECADRFEALGIEVHRLGLSKWTLQLRGRAVALRLARRFSGSEYGEASHTVWHAHGYYPTLLLTHLRRAHTLTTIHNRCDEDFRMMKGALMGGYMSRCYKRALRHLQCASPICDTMCSFYATDRRLHLCTVYNGVEPAPLPTPREREAARRAAGIAEGSTVLLYPATFSERKNQMLLIAALLRSGRSDLTLLLAGQGEGETQCRALAGGDARVRFLGYQHDLAPLWLCADYMVSPSRSEGLPMIALEAMLHGVPCLLSDIPPHDEVARRVMGRHGLLFPIGDGGAALTTLLQSLAPTSALSAAEIQQRALPLYSAEAMARGYEAIYDELIQSPRL